MIAPLPDFGPSPGARKPLQFRLWELLLFVAAASGFMFLTAPFVRNYNSVAAAFVECIGLAFFAAVWWKLRTRKWVEAATLAAVMLSLAALLLPPVQFAHTSASCVECAYNLQAIGVALHTYHEKYGSLPPAYVADASGKPMHSWRVLLLPFHDGDHLYQQYDFSEPWDGPKNIRLAPKISDLYQCRADSNSGLPSQTSYLAVTGRGTMWPGDKAARFTDAKDGIENVIAIVEVHNSGIQTTEPRDLDITRLPFAVNPKSGQGISSGHRHGANVLFADGSVHYLAETTTPQTLRKLLIIDNGSPKADDY